MGLKELLEFIMLLFDLGCIVTCYYKQKVVTNMLMLLLLFIDVVIVVFGLQRISEGCGDHIGVMGIVVVLRKVFTLLNFVESYLKLC